MAAKGRTSTGGRGSARSSASKGASMRRTNVGKTPRTQGERDAEAYSLDTTEVRGADGEVRILAEIDPSVDDEFYVAQPAPTVGGKSTGKAGGTKQGRPTVRGGAQPLSAAAQRALDKAEKAREKAEAETARLKAEAKQRKVDERQAAADKRQADRKAAADKREAERVARQEKRDADKAERARLRELAKGETGDPEKDAIFHEAVDKAAALAVVPPNVQALRMSVLNIPGVELTNMGLALPKGLRTTDWVEIVNGLRGAQDAAFFATGDALVFGEVEYGQAYDVLTDRLNIARSTVKNYKLVASTWPVEDRVEGASFYQHLYANALYRSNPAAARNLLEQAVAGQQNDQWVRAQVGMLMPARPTATPAVRRTDELARFADLTTEQFEADLAELGSLSAIEAARQTDLEALVTRAQTDAAVRSDFVLRNVARLMAQVQQLTAERDDALARAEAAEARLAELGEAQARVAGYAEGAVNVTTEGTTSGVGEGGGADALAFLRGAGSPSGDVLEGEYSYADENTPLTNEQIDEILSDGGGNEGS